MSDKLINLATFLVLCVVAATVVYQQRSSSAESTTTRSSERLDEGLGVDFSATPHTLLVVVQQSCEFCAESMAFYKRILQQRDQRGNRLRVVIVAPARDVGIPEYLGARGVRPDQVVHAQRGQLPVTIVPTLLLVDSGGEVIGTWDGILSSEQEEEVLGKLFGNNSSSPSH